MKKNKNGFLTELYLTTYKKVFAYFLQAENDEKLALDKAGRFWLENISLTAEKLQAKLTQMKVVEDSTETVSLEPDIVILQQVRHEDRRKQTEKRNRKRLLVWSVIAVIAACAVGVFLSSSNDIETSKVKLGNGDEISFIQTNSLGTMATTSFDERYQMLNSKSFSSKYPDLKDDALLREQAGMLNYKDFYQIMEQGKTADHIYSWETGYYDDGTTAVAMLENNAGTHYAVYNRGYVEVSVYKAEKPLRVEMEGYSLRDEVKLSSKINGKAALVTELLARDHKYGTYSAKFTELGKNDESVYVVAHNVDREYFIKVLQLIAGDDVELETVGSKQIPTNIYKEKDLFEAQKEIAIRNYAEKRVYDGCKGFILEDDQRLNIYSSLENEVQTHEGKDFNVRASFEFSNNPIIHWYMEVEYEDGVVNEIGTPLVEIH